MSKVTEVVRVHVHKRCVTELLLVTSKASIMWNNQPFRQQRSWAPAKGSVLPITSNLGLSVLLKDTTSGQEQLCIETSTLAATNGWHGRPVIREVATGWAKQAIAWGPQLKAPPPSRVAEYVSPQQQQFCENPYRFFYDWLQEIGKTQWSENP